MFCDRQARHALTEVDVEKCYIGRRIVDASQCVRNVAKAANDQQTSLFEHILNMHRDQGLIFHDQRAQSSKCICHASFLSNGSSNTNVNPSGEKRSCVVAPSS